MPTIDVDGLKFKFNDEIKTSKFDDWSFYRNQFSKMANGIKAVDIIVVENKTVYLVEVKDYRGRLREKSLDLATEIQIKVLSTLSAMIPASCNANDIDEKQFARQVCSSTKIRVVLHLEQSPSTSKLHPHIIYWSNLQQKLRKILKAVDPHPKVVNHSELHGLPWAVDP